MVWAYGAKRGVIRRKESDGRMLQGRTMRGGPKSPVRDCD